MAKSGVFLTFLGVVVCVQGRLFRTSPETCSTERTEMDITRTLTVTHEGVLKTVDCVARVSVNECEGSCLSTASPNVHTYPDFKKVKIYILLIKYIYINNFITLILYLYLNQTFKLFFLIQFFFTLILSLSLSHAILSLSPRLYHTHTFSYINTIKLPLYPINISL